MLLIKMGVNSEITAWEHRRVSVFLLSHSQVFTLYAGEKGALRSFNEFMMLEVS